MPKLPAKKRWGAYLAFIAGLIPVWERVRDFWGSISSSSPHLERVLGALQDGSAAHVQSLVVKEIAPMFSLAIGLCETNPVHPAITHILPKIRDLDSLVRGVQFHDEDTRDTIFRQLETIKIAHTGRFTSRIEPLLPVLLERAFLDPYFYSTFVDDSPPRSYPFDPLVVSDEWRRYSDRYLRLELESDHEILTLQNAVSFAMTLMPASQFWGPKMQLNYPSLFRRYLTNRATAVTNGGIERLFGTMKTVRRDQRGALSDTSIMTELNIRLNWR